MNLLIHVPTLSVMGIFAVFPQRGYMYPLFRVPTLPGTHTPEATYAPDAIHASEATPRPHAAHVSQSSHASRATDATVAQPMLSCDYVSFMIAFLHIFSNFADYG